MDLPRATAGVAPLDDSSILVVGGCRNGTSIVESSVEIHCAFQPNCEKVQVPALPNEEGRMSTQAVVLSLPGSGSCYPVSTRRCIAVVGGETLREAALQSVLPRQLTTVPVFDVQLMAWRSDSVIPAMPTPRAAAAACVGMGNVRR